MHDPDDSAASGSFDDSAGDSCAAASFDSTSAICQQCASATLVGCAARAAGSPRATGQQ